MNRAVLLIMKLDYVYYFQRLLINYQVTFSSFLSHVMFYLLFNNGWTSPREGEGDRRM